MANPRNLFSICSLLMSLLFAYSASVQLNDPDWYFWFPLYTLACAVNLMNRRPSPEKRRIRQMSKAALGLGLFLLAKVVVGDLVKKDSAGFLSLDLSQRVVREKIGSGLVVISLILHLEASSDEPNRRNRKHSTSWFDFGMAATVFFGYGLPFLSFTVQKGKMKF